MFKKVRKTRVKKIDGIVYLIKMELDTGEIVYKIGMTTRNSVGDRLGEVVVGFFMKYRYIPRTTDKKYTRFPNYLEVEKLLHKHYETVNYKFDKKFSGSTEFFKIEDEKELIKKYMSLLS